MTNATEFIDEPDAVRNEAMDNGLLVTDNQTTKLLRKLFEERGVSGQTHYLHASWRVGSKLYDAMDNLDGTLTVNSLTPEQAITATLGSGTCEMEPSFTEPSRLDFMQEYLCNECGEYAYLQIATDDDRLNFCPNCGRRVVR